MTVSAFFGLVAQLVQMLEKALRDNKRRRAIEARNAKRRDHLASRRKRGRRGGNKKTGEEDEPTEAEAAKAAAGSREATLHRAATMRATVEAVTPEIHRQKATPTKVVRPARSRLADASTPRTPQTPRGVHDGTGGDGTSADVPSSPGLLTSRGLENRVSPSLRSRLSPSPSKKSPGLASPLRRSSNVHHRPHAMSPLSPRPVNGARLQVPGRGSAAGSPRKSPVVLGGRRPTPSDVENITGA